MKRGHLTICSDVGVTELGCVEESLMELWKNYSFPGSHFRLIDLNYLVKIPRNYICNKPSLKILGEPVSISPRTGLWEPMLNGFPFGTNCVQILEGVEIMKM